MVIDGNEVFDANITHNLSKMAQQFPNAYEAIWNPTITGYVYAKEIIPILSSFLANMVTNSEKYREFDSQNGWGLFDNFVPWLIEYLEACKKYPNAKIEAYV